MRYSKHILFLLLILVIFVSCKKVKLEDDEKGKLLIGKWKYAYGGYHYGSATFIETINPYVDYEIEFLEGAKICFNEGGAISEYRIRRFGELENTSYGTWRAQLSYGKEKDKLYFRLNYYNKDSIGVETLPHTPYAPSNKNPINIFYRIE